MHHTRRITLQLYRYRYIAHYRKERREELKTRKVDQRNQTIELTICTIELWYGKYGKLQKTEEKTARAVI